MSSRGDMKISLKLMTFARSVSKLMMYWGSYIFMSEMLQEFELSVGPLREDGCTEGLHDFFDRHGLACQLVLCRTIRHPSVHDTAESMVLIISYQTSPKAPIPTGCKSVYLNGCQ